MTREQYLEMCEMLGNEPVESEIPIEFEDLALEVQDALRILMASFLALVIGLTLSLALLFNPISGLIFSLSIFVITLFLALVSMIGFRFLVKTIFQQV